MYFLLLNLIFASVNCLGCPYEGDVTFPLEGKPSAAQVIDLKGEKTFWISTEKSLYIYDHNGDLLGRADFGAGAVSIVPFKNYVLLARGRNLLVVSPQLELIHRKKFGSHIGYIEKTPGKVFVLSGRYVYALDEDLNPLWKRLLPGKADTMGFGNAYLAVKGRNWLYLISEDGDSLFLWHLEDAVIRKTLAWRHRQIIPIAFAVLCKRPWYLWRFFLQILSQDPQEAAIAVPEILRPFMDCYPSLCLFQF